MLKKIVLFVGLISSPYIFASEFMQCNFDSELGGGNEARISEIRDRAFDSCLKCEGNSCKMLLYPQKVIQLSFVKECFVLQKRYARYKGKKFLRTLGLVNLSLSSLIRLLKREECETSK